MTWNDDSAAFPTEVSEQVAHYVYRLLDPRNGETFYVGKGSGNRLFDHAKGVTPDAGDPNEKVKRILEIRAAGFAPQHVVHRHGMDEKTAFEVEAALMDAYPGISNRAGGHDNSDRGAAHASEIIERYSADFVTVIDKVVEINVRLTAGERGLYDATRFAWRLDPRRAAKASYAFAVRGGIIIGVFDVQEWLPATPENFAEFELTSDWKGRYGFIGNEASVEVKQKYLRKRVAPRARGAANPIRYHNI